MKRTEYLAELDRYLRKLPEDDYQEAMDYFTEYFDEAGPENEAAVMQELGTPKEAANDIIHNILGKSMQSQKEKRYSKKQLLWIVVLAVLTAPVTFSVALLFLASIITLILMIISLFLLAIALIITMIALGGFYIYDAFNLLQAISLPAASLSIGGGFLALGLGLIVLLVTYQLMQLCGRGIVLLAHRLTRKDGRA